MGQKLPGQIMEARQKTKVENKMIAVFFFLSQLQTIPFFTRNSIQAFPVSTASSHSSVVQQLHGHPIN